MSLILFGAACFVFAFFLGRRYMAFERRTCEHVMASVMEVETEEKQSNDNGRYKTYMVYRPVVRFVTSDGCVVHGYGVWRQKCDWDVGSEVDVWYDPNDPDVFRVAGEVRGSVMFSMMFGLVGFIAIACGLLSIFG